MPPTRLRRPSPATLTPVSAGTTTGGATPRTHGPLGPQHRLITLAIIALVSIVAFEAMAISTAMPIVAEDLHAVRSYGLAFSMMLTAQLLGIVVAGVWSDRRGPLRPLFAGQLLLAAGSAAAGLAPTFAVLLLGRVVAGLGGGLLVVALYVVIGRAYPDALRPKVFSWVSAAWVLPSLIGPPVAGWLATTWSWRWVFLVVVPPVALTLGAVLAQRRRLTGDPADTPAADRSHHRRTTRLGVLIAVSTGALQWGAQSLVPPRFWPLLATALGVAGVVVALPGLVPDGAWRMARGLPSVMASRFLLTASFNGANTFIPLMLVTQRHLGPTLSGAMLTAGALGWSAGSWVQGRDAVQRHRQRLIGAGGVCLATGLAGLAVVAALGLPYPLVGATTALTGLGMGLAMSSTSVLSLQLSPTSEHGRASSALQLSDALGSVAGIASAGAVFAALHHEHGSDVPVFVLIWSALALLALLVVVGGQRSRT